MATAEKIPEVVHSRVIQEVVQEEQVILTLSPSEAEAIVAVLARIGGYPNGTRQHSDAVLEALRAVAYDWPETVAHTALTGRLTFTDGHI